LFISLFSELNLGVSVCLDEALILGFLNAEESHVIMQAVHQIVSTERSFRHLKSRGVFWQILQPRATFTVAPNWNTRRAVPTAAEWHDLPPCFRIRECMWRLDNCGLKFPTNDKDITNGPHPVALFHPVRNSW